ncbi:Brix domain containing protein [Trichuris trichiura]|uniref:Brix domain containing protein n=1 Tax=Trichuris trichiura TaxID=36087 RepID=A0A077Z4B6_TRITR|nr:Brix domain containing protein [Trichuris trichiura]
MVRRSKASIGSQEPDHLKKAPHSFIFHRGRVGRLVRQLIRDMRMVFSPFTAPKLQVRKNNSLKDFVAVSGIFNVTHFLIFTRTEESVNLRIMHVPRGPTLSFKVLQYCLAADVVSALKKSLSCSKQFVNPPLLIFSHIDRSLDHVRLVQTMIQGMLPSLNIDSVRLDDIRRVVLINYDKEEGCFDFRHYGIKPVPVGVSKQAKIVFKRKVPDLGTYQDISEYFTNPEYLSESEPEEGNANVVELSQDLKARGCKKSTEIAVKLIEMGPRLKLQLYKVEEGFSSGPVLYHAFNSEHQLAEQPGASTLVIPEQRKRKRKQATKTAVKKKQPALENNEH